MFCSDPSLNYDDKPISIIITTLAAKAYANEANLYEALMNILDGMPNYIVKKTINGKTVTWVQNPVDSRENFADKWEAFPVREQNFYKWITTARTYFHELLQKEGPQILNESLQKGFGNKIVTRTFSAMGEETRILREEGSLKMQGGTGLLGLVGTQKVINHTFHGKKDNRLLPLLAQEKTILKYFPDSKTAIVGKKLIWKGCLQPTPFSKKYDIKISYESGKISIYVTNPKLDLCQGQTKLPHIYNAKKQQLCLYFKEWDGGMFIIDTIIPWASEWLYFYEIWLINGGIWLGGGTTHNSTIPKKQ